MPGSEPGVLPLNYPPMGAGGRITTRRIPRQATRRPGSGSVDPLPAARRLGPTRGDPLSHAKVPEITSVRVGAMARASSRWLVQICVLSPSVARVDDPGSAQERGTKQFWPPARTRAHSACASETVSKPSVRTRQNNLPSCSYLITVGARWRRASGNRCTRLSQNE